MESCLYCRDTGRTADNPYECTYCGKTYKHSNSKVKSVNFYIPTKVKDLALDWTPMNVCQFIKNKNTRVTDGLHRILNFLNTLTVEDNSQIVFNFKSYTYEIVFLSWAYHIYTQYYKLFPDIDTSITNLLVVQDLENLLNQPILIIEVVDFENRIVCEKIEALMTMRKRLGKPTYAFSNSLNTRTYFNSICQFSYDMSNPTTDINTTEDLFNTIIVVNETLE